MFSTVIPVVSVAVHGSLFKNFQSTDSYDMIVVAPSYYKTGINPLIEHKNNRGIQSIFVSTNDFYTNNNRPYYYSFINTISSCTFI